LIVVGLSGLAGFEYHLIVAFSDLWRNVFYYNGIIGIWGAGRLWVSHHEDLPFFLNLWFPTIARYGMFSRVFLSAFLKGPGSPQEIESRNPQMERTRERYLLKAFGWAFLVFGSSPNWLGRA
jgi:hypothetical protein